MLHIDYIGDKHMYCQNCGCENYQEAAFCQQCGVKLVKAIPSGFKNFEEEGKISSISKETTNNSDVTSTTKFTKTKAKKIILLFVSLLIVVVCVGSFFRISDKKCDWCNDNPSIRFKTNSGKTAYVCFDCCKECAWCGEIATRHYENLMEMIVFVCKDCYDEIKD